MKKQIALTLFILTCALNCALSYAQSNEGWLIPRTVFVGDNATLVLPLPPSLLPETGDTVLDAYSLLSTEDIDLRRVTLEKRVSGNRLLVEFTAFRPGLIELPLIEIAETSFSGLTVTIASLLDTSRAPELSRAASTLAMPGTAFLLYGTMAGFVLLILLAVWFFYRGRHLLHRLHEKWKRWSLFVFMKNTEKNLSRLLLRGENKREILDKLSDEFRMFLSFLSGKNCRAMTAGEFEKIPLEFETQVNAFLAGAFWANSIPENGDVISTICLGKFFRRCDELRFSGIDAGKDDIKLLLADLRLFLAAAEKLKTQPKPAKEEAA